MSLSRFSGAYNLSTTRLSSVDVLPDSPSTVSLTTGQKNGCSRNSNNFPVKQLLSSQACKVEYKSWNMLPRDR